MKIRKGVIAVILVGGMAILLPYVYVLAYVYATASVSGHHYWHQEKQIWYVCINSSHYGEIIIPPANTGLVYGNQGYINPSTGEKVLTASGTRSLYYPNNSATFSLSNCQIPDPSYQITTVFAYTVTNAYNTDGSLMGQAIELAENIVP